jgi:putative transposase
VRPGEQAAREGQGARHRVHQQVADRRKDFLHQLTADLVSEYERICIEDLNLKGLTRTKLAKSFTDASLGEFRRQVDYKSAWNRTPLIVIDRFFPSTRLCRGCGEVNQELTLGDRHWVCGCGMVHDRDLSAAINIRDEGLRLLAEPPGRVTPDRRIAQGEGIRPGTSGLPSSN